jgi:hypothetical protein
MRTYRNIKAKRSQNDRKTISKRSAKQVLAIRQQSVATARHISSRNPHIATLFCNTRSARTPHTNVSYMSEINLCTFLNDGARIDYKAIASQLQRNCNAIVTQSRVNAKRLQSERAAIVPRMQINYKSITKQLQSDCNVISKRQTIAKRLQIDF